MAAGKGEIYIEQYAKWEAIFLTYQDVANTIPISLSGYTNPRMQIKDTANANIDCNAHHDDR